MFSMELYETNMCSLERALYHTLYPTPTPGCPTPHTWHATSMFSMELYETNVCSVERVLFRTCSLSYLVPYSHTRLFYAPHSTFYTLHPTPYTLHHNTIHPAPCNLHPTPYTLHTTPQRPTPKIGPCKTSWSSWLEVYMFVYICVTYTHI